MKKKLHIGCGDRIIPGYTNVDMYQWGNVDIVTEAHRLHVIPDGSCEEIYASHVLEYYSWEEAEVMVLPEWWRVLVPNGVLKVAVPDFEALVNIYGAVGLDYIIGPLYGRKKVYDRYIYHKCTYDEKKIKDILEKTGFTFMNRYDWRTTDHADVDDCSQAYFPHMNKKIGLLISLNVWSLKGAAGGIA